MACGYPTGPARGEARLNSRFANVKSLRHCRRLKPRPGHPSACLMGPVGASVRWFSRRGNAFIRERCAVDRPFGASTLRGRCVGRKPQPYRGVPPPCWNSRFANVKSLRHCRRLTPRPGHPSACLTGPVGTLVRWLSSWENGFTREDFTVDRPFGASTLRGRRVGRKPRPYRGVPPPCIHAITPR